MEKSFQYYLGADVSHKTIDFSLLKKADEKIIFTKTIANTSDDLKKIMNTLTKIYGDIYVIMEATGNYHRKFVAELIKAGIDFSILNPLVSRRYAQMKMIRTKTDKIDSKTLALYAMEQNPKTFIVPSEAQSKLKDIITVRNQLIKQKTQNKNLLHSQQILPETNARIIKSIKKIMAVIDKEILKIEEAIEDILEENFSELYTQIKSIKGIGEKTAQSVIAHLGNLENFATYKQVSAFIGLNPKTENSGTSIKKQKGLGKQGNKQLRSLFYMSAMSAVKFNKTCRELYIRLVQKGKAKMSALIAVANKLVKQLFAIVRNNSIYSDDYIHPRYASL